MAQAERTYEHTSGPTWPLEPSMLADQPPDGGFRAWMSVLSGFFVIMNTWGMIISFGVFQSYYITTLHRTQSDIAWIGSFAIFLLFFMGTIAGRLIDMGHLRPVIVGGAFTTLLGTFMTSISRTYWQLFLAQGVCVGLGNGFLFAPVMAVISTYFSSKKALAMGIAACGSVTGGLVFPSMARTLLYTIGFGWTMRAIGLMQLITLSLAVILLKLRVAPAPSKSLVDWSAFRDVEYCLYTAGAFVTFIGVFVPFFFLSTYARNEQGLSYESSLNLVLFLNGIGFIGRLLPSILAYYLRMLNVFTLMVILSSLSMYTWAAVSSTTNLYVWTAFYSLFFGGIQSLLPGALSSLSSDPQKQGTQMGMVFSVLSFGCLIGTPVAGALISGSERGYFDAQIFAGTCLGAGGLLLVAAREVKRGKVSGDLLLKL